MAEIENGRERGHDCMAPNCKDPWPSSDPLAHCPRCCDRTDHVLIQNDHQLGRVVVSRWSHRGVMQEEEIIFRHADGTEESYPFNSLVAGRVYAGTIIKRTRNANSHS